jgi:acyl-CoA synthetase (AMP-forming)/AMP-acid ligase II
MTTPLITLLRDQSVQFSNHLALLDLNQGSMSYIELVQHIETTVALLNGAGLKRSSRVAIVLPNGPEMASLFLAVSSAMTAAPLNPNYQLSEYEFYLSDIQAEALIILQGIDSPARAVAQQHSIPVIELVPQDKAGSFRLDGLTNLAAPEFGNSEDTALLLHTSGTTSRPKMVVLTQANLCASASNIANALVLTNKDRCLNVMPLFHIHGLMAAVLAPLLSGGSVLHQRIQCAALFRVDK